LGGLERAIYAGSRNFLWIKVIASGRDEPRLQNLLAEDVK
jgi:hypothetical protein